MAGALGSTYNLGYTVTDACGRTANCTQVFTISNEGPSIVCPLNAVVACSSNIVPGTPVTSSSACSVPAVLTNTLPILTSGTADCPSATYEIEYTIMDEFGRSASCSQEFTIMNTAPTITCPIAETVACSADIMAGTAMVTSSCTLNTSVTTAGPTLVSGIADCNGAMYSLEYTVEDDCGRTASCSQTFTIANPAPTLVCPSNGVVECSTDIIHSHGCLQSNGLLYTSLDDSEFSTDNSLSIE